MTQAFLFPGQGAQYVGMGRDFYDTYAVARETFEEADAILGRPLSKIIFEGPEEELTKTHNSQAAIFVVSMAILRVLRQERPDFVPGICAGLSLGEYSAVCASGRLSFADCLPLVAARGEAMSRACEATDGTMAAILGLEHEEAIEMASTIENLWVANLNCPKQVVISGTREGVEAGIVVAKERGARRAMPLTVHGAFHSGLMKSAEGELAEKVAAAPLIESEIGLVMNVTGDFVEDPAMIRRLLVEQVTHPVAWEKGIRAIEAMGVDLYLEIGCGKTLTGMNKRIGTRVPTLSINKVEDLNNLPVGV